MLCAVILERKEAFRRAFFRFLNGSVAGGVSPIPVCLSISPSHGAFDIGRIQFQNQNFETTSASTVEDVLKLGSQGWIEYAVVKISNVEYHCFKKPKRFSSYV